MKEGATLIGFVWPAQNKELLERLAARKVTVLAMDAVPRITRAQKMDALSAMANIAGYRAVIEAASALRALLPRAGDGGRAGPAGEGARHRRRRRRARGDRARRERSGAVVRAFDTRPAVREQVESLGAHVPRVRVRGGGRRARAATRRR